MLDRLAGDEGLPRGRGGSGRADRRVGRCQHDVVHAERFASWIERVVVECGGRLMRLKGIVAVEGVPMRIILQGVGDAVEVSFGADWGAGPRRSRVVLIGVELDEPRLQKTFDACAP